MIQPWANLFVLRENQYETRTWKTNYRGSLAIHTSLKIDKSVCQHIAIQKLLGKHGYTPENLPTGKIIAICELVDCIKVVENNQTWAVLENGHIIEGNDYFLGDFRVGNYAWEVKGMKVLDEFISAKGKLGLWEYQK